MLIDFFYKFYCYNNLRTEIIFQSYMCSYKSLFVYHRFYLVSFTKIIIKNHYSVFIFHSFLRLPCFYIQDWYLKKKSL